MSKPTEQKKRVVATIERRRSNAAGSHEDKRTKRNRDRASRNRKAIDESRGN